jgi:hypothetical protein
MLIDVLPQLLLIPSVWKSPDGLTSEFLQFCDMLLIRNSTVSRQDSLSYKEMITPWLGLQFHHLWYYLIRKYMR